jgi:hypothetical protein
MENIRGLIYNRYSIDIKKPKILNELMKQTEKEIIHNMYNQLDPLLTNFIITHNPKNLDDFRRVFYTKCDFILELINKTKQQNYNPRDKKRFIKNQNVIIIHLGTTTMIMDSDIIIVMGITLISENLPSITTSANRLCNQDPQRDRKE